MTEPTVTITTSKNSVAIGESVTFTIASDIDILRAQIYANGTLIRSRKFPAGGGTYQLTDSESFDSRGVYTIDVVVNDNYSATTTITVGMQPPILTFESASYYSCNGDCTVKAILTQNNSGLVGETITLTGTGSSLTAITDSNGVVTFNLTSISTNLTLTATYETVTDTCTVIIGENTLNGSLTCLGKRMAYNLQQMGVIGADASDGLTTLTDSILDIEPSTNIDLDIDCTLSSSSSSIVSGGSVILYALLLASYDATPASLKTGEITGATILFKEGNTTVGTGTTGLDGIATATLSNLSVGEHTFKAIFEGTTNFDNAESSTVTVTVETPTPDSMSLVKSAGKQILSYDDVSGGDEYCTVKATVYDANDNPLAGETVTFSIGGTTVKSDVTDSNGEITYTYNSQGSGDVTITAECSLLTKTYSIQDKIIYDLSSNDGLSHFGSVYEVEGKTSATISYDSTESAYKLLSTGNGLKTIPLTCLTGKDSFKLSFDIKPVSDTYYGSGVMCLGTNHSGSGVAFGREGNTTRQTINHTFLNNSWNNNANLNYSFTSGTWYTFEMTVDGTEISIDIKTGGTVVKSVTFDLLDKSSTLFNTLTDRQYAFSIGYDSSNQRVSYIKNIQAEPL